MDRRILELGRALRDAGAPVSTPELLDAQLAALAVGVASRGDLRGALRAALVKRAEHLPAFEALFARFFPAAPSLPQGRRRAGAGGAGGDQSTGAPRTGPGGGGSGTGDEGRSERPTAVRGAGEREGAPAGESGEPGEPGDEGRGAATGGAERGEEPRHDGASRDGDRRDAAARRRLLEKGFRERWAGAEEREAAAAVEGLALRLATRLARRRRRSRRGAVDLAGTLRANLVHGGVPFLVRRKARVPGRRDLVVLVDVSGSVRRASALFLLILGRLRGRLSGVRAFAYVDRPAEVPGAIAARGPARIAAQLAAALPLDALSDHGEMLRRFNRDFRSSVTGRSVVVVLGDGRNNRFPAQEWELEALRRRCRRLFWIVPEPSSLWGSADSAIRAYAPHCDRLLAAPTPRALAAAAALLLPAAGSPGRGRRLPARGML